MNTTQLMEKVESLKHSSAFRAGDATTFGVRILVHEAELPGPCKAADYMGLVKRKLGVEFKAGERVLVVGAGNGGLCAEALLAGAAEVLAVEPRYRYFDGIEAVIGLLGEVYPDAACRTFRGWPSTGAGNSLGRFDLILWSEGLEEAPNPVENLTAVLQLLKPTGRAVIEVTHGDMGIPAGKTNAFFPSEDTWTSMLEGLTGEGPMAATQGRAGRRMVYAIGRNAAIGTVKPTPTPGLPAFPKDPPPQTVYRSTFRADVAPAQPAPPPPPPPPAPVAKAPEKTPDPVIPVVKAPEKPAPIPVKLPESLPPERTTPISLSE